MWLDISKAPNRVGTSFLPPEDGINKIIEVLCGSLYITIEISEIFNK
jgi:hypothetical protein